MATIDNGVNVQALLDARGALAEAPEAAQFTWRASSKWPNGVHSTTTVQDFFGLGEEQSHKTEDGVRRRSPRDLRRRGQRDHADRVSARRAGGLPDRGRGVRSRRTAASSCARSSRRSRATTTSAGFLGVDSDVRNGFNDIKVTFTIDADASREEIEALVAQSQKRSAVFDALANPTEVTVTVA